LYEKQAKLSLDGIGAENPKNPTLWLSADKTWQAGRFASWSPAAAEEEEPPGFVFERGLQ
jgi:hypothetical protein